MATKVEQSAIVEPHGMQATVSVPPSSAVSASPKVSMFGAKKSGFVIPKNKLSGAMVPIYRGGGKVDASETSKEESIAMVQRKTKWGTDLTQDASVRKGRALAYQTRVEQITKQLKSGALDIGENQSLQSSAEVENEESSTNKIDELGKRELLELEKREIIGEILQLNPSYKAPADYKPLLKEAKVPIPLKAYPGYNFIRLVLGPESKTQKRLEEETGATVRVHGTIAETGEEKEITLSDGEEDQITYEELYVHISADTYEKVDAAVALIELLVTPVSGSSVPVSANSASGSGDDVSGTEQGRSSTATYVMPAAAGNLGLMQPMGSVPAGHPIQFQSYSSPWVQQGPPNTTFHPPSGFIPPPDLAPLANNSLPFSPSPANHINTNPFLGVRPSTQAFGTMPRSTSFVSGQLPMQVLQHPFTPELQSSNQNPPHQNLSMPSLHSRPQSIYPSVSAMTNSSLQPPVISNQSIPSGPTPVRPSMPVSGNPSVWSVTSNIQPPMVSSSNMMQMIPPSVPQSQYPTAPQSMIPSSTPQSTASVPMISRPPAIDATITPSTYPNRPSNPLVATPPTLIPSSMSASTMIPNSVAPASIALVGALSRPISMPVLTQALTPIFSQALSVNVASAPVLGQAPPHSQPSSAVPMQPVMVRGSVPSSVASSVPSFSHVKATTSTSMGIQSILAPKPQRPSSNDFTFQPQRPQLPASSNFPRLAGQALSQNTPMHQASVVPPAPQSQPFRPTINNSPSATSMLGFPRPLAANQMGQPSFTGNQTMVQMPQRVPSFPNQHPRLPATPPQMRMPGFFPAQQVPNPHGPLPIRPGNQLPLSNRPGNFMVPNQQLGFVGGRPTVNPLGGNQIYDPFSPTSISVSHQQGGRPPRKQETDAEYEDLMASVGVK